MAQYKPLHTAEIRPKHGGDDMWGSIEPVTKQGNFLSYSGPSFIPALSIAHLPGVP